MAYIVKSSLDLSGKIVSWTDKELSNVVKEKTQKFEKETINKAHELVEEAKEKGLVKSIEELEEKTKEPVEEKKEERLFKSDKKSDRKRK